MDLFERVSEDIKTAMKAKDKVALETLRNIKKVFLEAKTAPGANDTLTDDAALKIMQKLMKQGKDAAEIYIQQGRQDLADAELAQVKVIEVYLPKQMSAEELEAALKEQNVKEAFRAAHTMKGVCQNLGFSNLYAPAVTLTETLRAGQLEGTAEQFAEVEKQYRITMAAIQALD